MSNADAKQIATLCREVMTELVGFSEALRRVGNKDGVQAFEELAKKLIRAARLADEYHRVDHCEHGIREGDWCPKCNAEYKQAQQENED